MRNTTLCHIEKNGRYLMLHRVKKENDLNRDKWVGIGGKFEDKESPEEANQRETLEETGLTLKNAEYRGIVTFVSDKWETEYMHIFYADKFEGTVKECDEGELCWVNKKDIFSLPIWEGDKIFLRLLDEKTPFFSLKLEYMGERLVNAVLNGEKLNVGKGAL
ncbi:MAG TPA: DNA mismatch repair protein MutT [Ruminococcaceae bacterium]|nr:DNA mismatch repair protein MutT [Oscillospiraceae bacterium]